MHEVLKSLGGLTLVVLAVVVVYHLTGEPSPKSPSALGTAISTPSPTVPPAIREIADNIANNPNAYGSLRATATFTRYDGLLPACNQYGAKPLVWIDEQGRTYGKCLDDGCGTALNGRTSGPVPDQCKAGSFRLP